MTNGKKTKKTDRERLFQTLAKLGIASFTVEFEGESDNGQIEDVNLPATIQATRVNGTRYDTDQEWSYERQQYVPRVEKRKTVMEVAQGIVNDILEERHGGWEINDGAYGTFKFNVPTQKITLTFHERIMDVNTWKSEV